ncbi:MAG: 1,2-phenylacetyl-CoA epoxidase subunit PaaE [Pseudomonadota bacterium]
MFHDLTISNVEHITDDAVALGFDVPDEIADKYHFTPGQYLTLRADVNGEDVRRSYSICSVPGQELKVGIKKVENGRFSTFAQSLKPGDTLQVMAPEGRFTCKPNGSGGRNFILIAAGSGITPVLSIARSVMENEPDSRVTLIFGNRTTTSIMFREDLEDLKDRFLERFHVYHVLSREAQDVELFHGRVDIDRIADLTANGVINPKDADGIYLCGPAEMTLSIEEHFKQAGVGDGVIHTELFETPGEDKPVVISKAVKQAAEAGVKVDVVIDGITKNFVLADENDTVLKAAAKSGLELPFSCAGGMCATCRCKVVEGDAEMDKNYSLDDWELEAGFVLACQTRPKSEKLTLDFDAT